MAGPYGPRYSGAGDELPLGQGPYGYQGEPQPMQVPQQPRRPSEAAQQEARWLAEQQAAEEAEYAQGHQRGSSYGAEDPYAPGGQAAGYAPQGTQGPYAAYPHEAPYQQQSPEQDAQRLTEDEFFDPYAPAAGARHTHRRTSSTEGGYPTYFPPVYQVSWRQRLMVFLTSWCAGLPAAMRRPAGSHPAQLPLSPRRFCPRGHPFALASCT